MQPPEIQALLQRVTPVPDETLKQQLQNAINYLIVQDFEKLVHILYTVDVDEKRLKSLLQQQPQQDAAALITALLVERQLQKIAMRQRFNSSGTTSHALLMLVSHAGRASPSYFSGQVLYSCKSITHCLFSR